MEFEYLDPSDGERALPVHPAEHIFAAMARSMVEAQRELDEAARAAILEWENNGVPPSAVVWSLCTATFPSVLGCRPKQEPGEQTRMSIAPRQEARGGVSFSIRYHTTPLEEP